MLWETSILNKLYKTNEFNRIKRKALIGKTVYVLDKSTKFSNTTEKASQDETEVNRVEQALFEEYDLRDLHAHTRTVEFYSSQLFFGDCVRQVIREVGGTAELDAAVKLWVTRAF